MQLSYVHAHRVLKANHAVKYVKPMVCVVYLTIWVEYLKVDVVQTTKLWFIESGRPPPSPPRLLFPPSPPVMSTPRSKFKLSNPLLTFTFVVVLQKYCITFF
jgi:hypothetical protein